MTRHNLFQQGCGFGSLPFVLTMAFISFFYIAAPSTAYAFKPTTHIYSANEVLKSIKQEGDRYFFELDSILYEIDPRVASAIKQYPDYFRGGAIGPDGFPDIMFGQSIIHPDNRCNTPNAPPPLTCDMSNSGRTFTREWMSYIFEKGWETYLAQCNNSNLYSPCGNAEANQVLAFTYGFLLHGVGDIWSHTFVNHYARGVFPDLFSSGSNHPPSCSAGATLASQISCWPADKQIAVRHILVEGLIGKYTPATNLSINAPLTFIRDKFIVSIDVNGKLNIPTAMAKESLYKKFADLHNSLQDNATAICDTAVGAAIILSGVVPAEPISGTIAHTACMAYLDNWRSEIRNGLEAWPTMSLEVSRALFSSNNITQAKNTLKDFADNHLKCMVGVPCITIDNPLANLVVDTIDAMVMAPIKVIRDAYLTKLEDYLIEQATGIPRPVWEEIFQNAESSMTTLATSLALTNAVSDIKGKMHLTANSEFDPNQFATVANTILHGQLMLLNGSQMDDLVYRYSVGRIYGINPPIPHYYHGETISDDAKARSPALGVARSIDAHQQWRLRSDTAPWYGTSAPLTSRARYSETMPIWLDCLARERFFETKFTDDVGAGFPKDTETCDPFGEISPATVYFVVNGNYVYPRSAIDIDTLQFPECRAISVTVIARNHQDQSQNYGLYVHISGPPSGNPLQDQEAAKFSRGTLSSWPNGEASIQFAIPCSIGTYKIDAYLYKQLWTLDLPQNVVISTNPPTFRALVPTPYSFIINRVDNKTACSVPLSEIGDCQPGVSFKGSTATLPTCSYSQQSNSCGSAPNIITLHPLGNGDLDGDGINDAADNCPFDSNAGQQVLGDSGVGAGCAPVTVIPHVPGSWNCLSSPTCIAKLAEVASLSDALQSRHPPASPCDCTGPLCTSCPRFFEPYLQSWQRYLLRANAANIPRKTLRQTVGNFFLGFDINTMGPSLKSGKLIRAAGGRYLLKFAADGKPGTVRMNIPRSILDVDGSPIARNLQIRVNGRQIRASQVEQKQSRILVFTLPAGSSEVQISGNRIGPLP